MIGLRILPVMFICAIQQRERITVRISNLQIPIVLVLVLDFVLKVRSKGRYFYKVKDICAPFFSLGMLVWWGSTVFCLKLTIETVIDSVIKKITGVIIKWFSLRVFRQKNSSDLFKSSDDYWSGLARFVSMKFILWDLHFLTVTCWVDVQYLYVVMPFPWLEVASRNDSVWQCLLETYLKFDDYGK